MKNSLVLYFFFFSFNCFAQSINIDSLKHLIGLIKVDTEKVKVYNQIAMITCMSQPEKSKKYADSALLISTKLNYSKGIADAFNNLGHIDYLNANYDVALNFFIKALKIYEELKNQNQLYTTLNYIGDVYYYQEDYVKTLKFYQNALKIASDTKNQFNLANSDYNIAWVYQETKDYKSALEFFNKSFLIFNSLNNLPMMSRVYNGKAVCYNLLNDYDHSLENHFNALKIKEQMKDSINFLTSYMNIGIVYANKHDFTKARDYLNKAIFYSRKYNEKEKTKEIYIALSETCEKENDFKNSLLYYKKYIANRDTLLNLERSKQIVEIETRYETEKKEKEIQLLNKDKEIQATNLKRQKTIRNTVTLGLLLVLVFSFLLANRFLLIKKQKKVIETEKNNSEKLLLNILPKETADELKMNNKVAPKHYDSVTVMFTDFKGFTTLSEKLSVEQLLDELNYCISFYDSIMKEYHIEKIKTIGDSYMCAGGLPVPNNTNPLDVVNAGLRIQQFMSDYKKQRVADGKLFFECRLGIHTGPVIAGVIGTVKFAYDIWGDTVNTASRMESSGEVGKVNISGETYNKILDIADFKNPQYLKFTYRGKIPAKNKGEVEMYFVEHS